MVSNHCAGPLWSENVTTSEKLLTMFDSYTFCRTTSNYAIVKLYCNSIELLWTYQLILIFMKHYILWHLWTMISASPPQFVSFDDLMAAANGVKNMSLAHEIAVNHNFKLEKLEPSASRFEMRILVLTLNPQYHKWTGPSFCLVSSIHW